MSVVVVVVVKSLISMMEINLSESNHEKKQKTIEMMVRMQIVAIWWVFIIQHYWDNINLINLCNKFKIKFKGLKREKKVKI